MKKKILIVEDDLDLRHILQMVFENLAYDSILAVNGKEAVDLATSQLPDLILMDIMLPEMDGFQATRLIRENPNTHSTPILALTARVTIEDKKKCFRSGCDDYIAKPFQIKELTSCVEKLLKQNQFVPSRSEMKKKILIVEDDLDMLNILQGELRDIFEIIPATNGKEAVDLATSQVPDLVVMDIMLPEMDGLEALKLIKENPTAKTIPVILLSALGDYGDIRRGSMGANYYITKPYTRKELLNGIKFCLGEQ